MYKGLTKWGLGEINVCILTLESGEACHMAARGYL